MWVSYPEIDFSTLEVRGDSFVWWNDTDIERITFETPLEAANNAIHVADRHVKEGVKFNMCYGGPGRSAVDVAFWKVTGYMECRVAICEIIGYLDVWAKAYNLLTDAYDGNKHAYYRLRNDLDHFKNDPVKYQEERKSLLEKYGSRDLPLTNRNYY